MNDAQAGGTTQVPPALSSPDDALIDAVERAVLGGGPRYTRAQVAELTGVDLDRLTRLWRGMGFASPQHEDDALFLDSDVQAVRNLQALLSLGLLRDDEEAAMARMMGRTFSRLASWEVGQLAPLVRADQGPAGLEPADVAGFAAGLLPVIQELHDHVWRRHLAGAAGRALIADTSEDHTEQLTVGFADIVGFTRNTRSLTTVQLAGLVESFEGTTTDVVASARGRIIKTIGDEVLFVTPDPAAAAGVALELLRRHTVDDQFPEVRIGLAHGPVLNRLGDVFGETVNIASRLTSQARPGTVLVNKELAEALETSGAFTLRKTPRAHVKGYSRLEMWALRPGDEASETPLH